MFEFFTNTDEATKASSVVDSKAFSLTKVLVVLAPLVTALGTWAADSLKTVNFTANNVTAIIISLIALWTVTSAADVVARGVATSAAKRAEAGAKVIRFDVPVPGELLTPADPNQGGTAGRARHVDVKIAAKLDASHPMYLCVLEDLETKWVPVEDVHLKAVPILKGVA